uniref:Uncharacterized protein n=1 Tax=Rhizochromulina marina TaxID=1034831 RepID=A0A7S2RTX3_9STRA
MAAEIHIHSLKTTNEQLIEELRMLRQQLEQQPIPSSPAPHTTGMAETPPKPSTQDAHTQTVPPPRRKFSNPTPRRAPARTFADACTDTAGLSAEHSSPGPPPAIPDTLSLVSASTQTEREPQLSSAKSRPKLDVDLEVFAGEAAALFEIFDDIMGSTAPEGGEEAWRHTSSLGTMAALSSLKQRARECRDEVAVLRGIVSSGVMRSHGKRKILSNVSSSAGGPEDSQSLRSTDFPRAVSEGSGRNRKVPPKLRGPAAYTLGGSSKQANGTDPPSGSINRAPGLVSRRHNPKAPMGEGAGEVSNLVLSFPSLRR